MGCLSQTPTVGAWRAVCLTYAACVASLTDRSPKLDRDRLVRDLVPPPRFDGERFSTYRPDPSEPSQAANPFAFRRSSSAR